MNCTTVQLVLIRAKSMQLCVWIDCWNLFWWFGFNLYVRGRFQKYLIKLNLQSIKNLLCISTVLIETTVLSKMAARSPCPSQDGRQPCTFSPSDTTSGITPTPPLSKILPGFLLRRLVIYLFPFNLRGIFYISVIFSKWMTVGSDTYMPKSKAPKMDDLDYSKSPKNLVFFYLVLFNLAKWANVLACAVLTFHRFSDKSRFDLRGVWVNGLSTNRITGRWLS